MPGIGTTPYPTAEQVLNVARSALADAGYRCCWNNIELESSKIKVK
jgi:hypothetical protein